MWFLENPFYSAVTLYTVLKIIMQLFYKALNCVKQKTCTKTNAHWFDRKMFWEASHVDT